MSLLLHYTGQDYTSRGLLNTELTPGSTSAIVGGCKTGKGFVFDSTLNSVLSSQLDEERTIHSFSVWFRIQNITSVRFISAFGQTGFLQFMLWQRVNGEFVFGYCNAEGTQINIILNSNLPRDIWYHFGATINGLEMKLYLNGSLIKTHTAVSIRKGSDKILQIGGGTVLGTNYMLGQICNFKYYNHVLSAREIAEDYRSLMLHYKLDKPITTQVFDHSGFNRHISVIENTTTNSTTEKRVYGGSLANDGTKSLYGSLNLTELNGINEISVAVRFRFVQQEGAHCYFGSRTAANNGGINLFKLGGTSRDFYVDMGWRNTFTLSYDLVTGTWYDLVAVKSNIDVRLYINGVLVGSVPNTNSISNMGQLYASISRSIADDNPTSSIPMNGNVQDIRFYAKALTQEEVTELYQTRHMVDKDSNCYTYELIEGQATVGMNKQGQLLCDEIIENEDGTFQIANNKTIKTKEIKEI